MMRFSRHELYRFRFRECRRLPKKIEDGGTGLDQRDRATSFHRGLWLIHADIDNPTILIPEIRNLVHGPSLRL
jgi:hypothetical protein